MEIRSGAMPEEPHRPTLRDPVGEAPSPAPRGYRPPAEDGDTTPDVDERVLETGPWRADVRLTITALLGFVVFVAAALLVHDKLGAVLLVIAALICALYGVRGVLAPVRLSADGEGLTVIRGYRGRARLAWADVERVTVQRRSRLGMRSQFLEIDAGEQLYLLSPYDLSTEPDAVAASLRKLRTGA
jgi:hypothetical protein